MASFGDENRQMAEAMAQLSQVAEIIIEGIQGVRAKCFEIGLPTGVADQVAVQYTNLLFTVLSKNIK